MASFDLDIDLDLARTTAGSTTTTSGMVVVFVVVVAAVVAVAHTRANHVIVLASNTDCTPAGHTKSASTRTTTTTTTTTSGMVVVFVVVVAGRRGRGLGRGRGRAIIVAGHVVSVAVHIDSIITCSNSTTSAAAVAGRYKNSGSGLVVVMGGIHFVVLVAVVLRHGCDGQRAAGRYRRCMVMGGIRVVVVAHNGGANDCRAIVCSTTLHVAPIADLAAVRRRRGSGHGG
jgi:hypothetical protein